MIWVGVLIAILSTLLRFFCRWRVKRHISIDDVFVFVAVIILICMAILYALVTRIMFDLDAVAAGKATLSPDLVDEASFYLKCQFAIIVMFWTTLWAVKMAILFFYKDLFNRLPKQMALWWTVFGVVILFYLGCWGSQLASCAPIEGYFTLGTRTELGREIWLIWNRWMPFDP